MKIFKSLGDDELVELLQSGAVGVAPTDTIYGLVAPASNPSAVARLYALKHREHKPGTVIAAGIEQLVDLGIKRRYLKAVEQFWPGAVGVEISHQLGYLSQDTGRQAFRVTNYKELSKLLKQTGPLLTSSANQPGEPPANTIAEAQEYFGDSVDFYVDGGDLSGRSPSTLIRIIDDAIEVLRQGAVKIK
jgi:L-threonylcarbamoyladenylate synthase